MRNLSQGRVMVEFGDVAGGGDPRCTQHLT